MSTTIYTKRIIVPTGNVKRIAAEIGVSGQAVRNALRFITEGEQPDRIRKEALENYGGAVSTINKRSRVVQ